MSRLPYQIDTSDEDDETPAEARAIRVRGRRAQAELDRANRRANRRAPTGPVGPAFDNPLAGMPVYTPFLDGLTRENFAAQLSVGLLAFRGRFAFKLDDEYFMKDVAKWVMDEYPRSPMTEDLYRILLRWFARDDFVMLLHYDSALVSQCTPNVPNALWEALENSRPEFFTSAFVGVYPALRTLPGFNERYGTELGDEADAMRIHEQSVARVYVTRMAKMQRDTRFRAHYYLDVLFICDHFDDMFQGSVEAPIAALFLVHWDEIVPCLIARADTIEHWNEIFRAMERIMIATQDHHTERMAMSRQAHDLVEAYRAVTRARESVTSGSLGWLIGRMIRQYGNADLPNVARFPWAVEGLYVPNSTEREARGAFFFEDNTNEMREALAAQRATDEATQSALSRLRGDRNQ